MHPSKKEIKCIEISGKFRSIAINRKIAQLKKHHIPIILTPSIFSSRFDINFKEVENLWWKQILFILVFTIFYLILIPIFVVLGIGAKIFDRKNSLSKQINEIIELYHLDNEMSEAKTFSQLWDDKGLRDYGLHWRIFSGYTKKEQRQCIYEWFKILYGETNQLDKLIEEIKNRQILSTQQFYKENPLSHISIASIESMLPEEIDLHFRHYSP